MLGYIAYALLLTLPGLALIKWLRLDEEDISGSLGIALGLSLVITTLIIAVKTLGNLYGIVLVGLTGYEASLILLFSAVALIIYFLKYRTLPRPKPKGRDLLVFLFTTILIIIIIAHFNKYPIFPKYNSVDFKWHVRLARELEAGSYSPIAGGLLYFGAQAQIALGHQLMKGILLIDAQHSLAIMVILSPFLIYACAKRIFENTRAGSVAVILYVLTGFIWYGSVFNAGLYANFYGILASLMFLATMARLLKRPDKLLWLLYILVILNLYLSHYTTIILILALPFVLILHIFQRKRFDAALPILTPLIIGAIGASAFPAQLGALAGFLQPTGYEAVIGETNLSYQLKFLPVLRYLATVITQDLSTILLLALFLASVPLAFKIESPLAKLPFLWALSALVLAPLGPTAWRFSYAALLPLALCASHVLPTYIKEEARAVVAKKEKARMKAKRPKIRRYSALLLILLVLSAYGWSHLALADSLESTNLSRLTQAYVYESMLWMKENLEPGTKVLVITDWRIEAFLEEIAGINAKLLFLAKPEYAVEEAKRGRYSYIVMTVLVPAELPEGFEREGFFKAYLEHSSLSLKYNNPNVYVFKVID